MLSGNWFKKEVVIPGQPARLGPETMNTRFRQVFTGLCSWIPGSRAVPAPRKDIVCEFPDNLLRGDDEERAQELNARNWITTSFAGMTGGAGARIEIFDQALRRNASCPIRELTQIALPSSAAFNDIGP
jgi:hypothetical protein